MLIENVSSKTSLTHLCPPLRSTFAVRETDVSRHNGGASGAPLKPLRDDSALSRLKFANWRQFLCHQLFRGIGNEVSDRTGRKYSLRKANGYHARIFLTELLEDKPLCHYRGLTMGTRCKFTNCFLVGLLRNQSKMYASWCQEEIKC